MTAPSRDRRGRRPRHHARAAPRRRRARDVTLLERAPSLGGLAGAFDFGGHRVDRFYHVIVPSDERMLALAEELGLRTRFQLQPVGVGFFVDGKMYPFNGLGDFARFPPLSPLGRARLAWFVLQCQLRSDYAALEDVPLDSWLRRHCGDASSSRIWRPLLDSRFDSDHDELPATYLWARTQPHAQRADVAGRGRDDGLPARRPRAPDRGRRRPRRRARRGHPPRRRRRGPRLRGRAASNGVMVDGEAEPFDLTHRHPAAARARRLLPESLSGACSTPTPSATSASCA